MSTISVSTHVLDTSSGKPGSEVTFDLFRYENDTWSHIHRNMTSEDGRSPRIEVLASVENSTFKLNFDVGTYYKRKNVETIYPFVEIVFNAKDNEHYHIPLLISPFGYSTYRGS